MTTKPKIDRGTANDQDRWLAELARAEEAEAFPLGGSLILAESPTHALEIAEDFKARGHRVIVRGAYVRTTLVLDGDKS